jgi:hypothetical protein
MLKSRYLLRAENGFLSASHTIEGPPIVIVPTPENATRFVDLISAVLGIELLHPLIL